jgi:hypothetical protein
MTHPLAIGPCLITAAISTGHSNTRPCIHPSISGRLLSMIQRTQATRLSVKGSTAASTKNRPIGRECALSNRIKSPVASSIPRFSARP